MVEEFVPAVARVKGREGRPTRAPHASYRANVAASSGGGAAATARSSRSRAAVASTSGHLSRNSPAVAARGEPTLQAWDFFAGGLLASPRVRFFGGVEEQRFSSHCQSSASRRSRGTTTLCR